MIRVEVWQHLGIAITTDSKAIRSAYATRLKALDVDADRDRFALLREARDQALAWAAVEQSEAIVPLPVNSRDEAPPVAQSMDDLRMPALPGGPADPHRIAARLPGAFGFFAGIATAPGFKTPAATLEASTMALPRWIVPFLYPLPAAEGRIVIQREQVRDDHALHAILLPPEDESAQQALTEEETARAHAHIGALCEQAKAGDIGFDANVQAWLSETLARAWPRSQPLLAHAAALFRWEDRTGEIGVAPAIAYINQRIGADRFSVAVQDKSHPLNTAWRQLVRPARDGQTRASWRQPKRIQELIEAVRRDYPELESRFDPHRLALWEERPRTSGRVSLRFWAVGLFILIRVVFAVANHQSEPLLPSLQRPADMATDTSADRNPNPAPGSLTERNTDMTTAIHAALGPDVTPEQLHDKVPLVEMLFRVNWTLALDQRTSLADYVAGTSRIVRNRYALLARQAGGEELVALQSLRLAEAQTLKTRHWKACARLARSGLLADADLIPVDMLAGERKRIAKLVFSMPANPEQQRRDPEPFKIPAAIVKQTMASSGLSLDEMRGALNQTGSDEAQCLAHIAILKAVLGSDATTKASLLRNI